jgi:hypothetical protein
VTLAGKNSLEKINNHPALAAVMADPNASFRPANTWGGTAYGGSGGVTDSHLTDLQVSLGKGNVPTLKTKAEFDDLVNNQGWLGAYRGVGDAKYQDLARTGPMWTGTGMYGNGNYAAYYDPKHTGWGPTSATGMLKGATSATAAKTVALGFGAAVTRYAIPPTANVIDVEDVKKKRAKDTAAMNKAFADGKISRTQYTNMIAFIADNGRWASLNGYDAVRVSQSGYLVMLNRSDAVMQDDNNV